MFKLPQTLTRYLVNNGRLPIFLKINHSSSSTIVEAKRAPANFEPDNHEVDVKSRIKSHNNIVAAAFASLREENATTLIETPYTDEKITQATSVDELLSISEGNGISRRHALKVVSVLADWSSSGKTQIAEFENDSRFLRLCKVLTRGSYIKNKSITSKNDDLSTILSVTADDEAAKLVASITLPQMVKVMTTLSLKKRRSTLLLRAISYNITASPEYLNIKESADLLYSMATLNFIDENLFVKVSDDIIRELKSGLVIKKSSAIGSLLTSFGLLKYKNPNVLDALSEWVVNHNNICRPQDLFSLFMTLAVLNYTPTNANELFEEIMPQLTLSEARKPVIWLDVVWSLVLLNRATHEHIASVLSKDFTSRIEGNKVLTPPTKLKILNINAAAQYLTKDYKGDRLPEDSSLRQVQLQRTKDKMVMVESLLDTLKNLIGLQDKLQLNIDSGLGFYIDAVCVLDKKCNPLPLDATTEDAVRVAILVHDYHDMTRGKVEPTGINAFVRKILEKQGYKVLVVPFTEFKSADKLVHRVRYLESKLKEIVK